ncbi:MAG: cytochrome b/b6 domain-containing protein, partial [Gammaproteobacteria bacterium]|nr:cytochrome b/b6 domain-containing protein [Gammaproteobacteria bacterium]
AQFASAWNGAMEWHFRGGYCVLALVMFRVVWGFIGGHWSRFVTFAYAPRSIVLYLRGRAAPGHLVGHTPLGSLSVFALIVVVCLQVVSGLFSDDEIAASGPLARMVSNASVALATGWHAVWGQWILLTLVILHLAAVAYYVRVRRQELIWPMVSGDKHVPESSLPASRDDGGSRVMALLVFVACALTAAWVASLRA